jgi:predicted amidohydrolase YtcJ
LIPGFNDAHIHLRSIALKGLRCDLGGAGSAAEVVDELAAWMSKYGSEGPIVGVDWDQSAWDDPAFPTRDMLDAVSERRPVYARRICGHVGVVNSAFLRLFDDPGVAQFIDTRSGIITEDAVYAANRMSHPPAEAIVPAVEVAIGKLHAHGITGIHDIVDQNHYDAYLDGLRESRIPLRVDALLHVDVDGFSELADRAKDLPHEVFRPLGIKIFSDGSFGGRTAALHSPYSDAHTLGEFLLDENVFADTLRSCLERGVFCAVHAIGDRALRTVLMEMLKYPSDDVLFRIEHAELAGWDEIRLLEKAPVFVSMQPNFVRNWQQAGGMYDVRLGRDRSKQCNRFRSFQDAGIRYIFGSDGMPPGPLYGMRGATHHPVDEERIPLTVAMEKYTSLPATFGPHRKTAGLLAKGHWADFVVLSGDISVGDPDLLRVDETYIDGERVYAAAGSSGDAVD